MATAPSSLCPGYREVEEFGPDEEYEDEEVCYVTLDMGNVEPTLVPSSSSYRLIGLDTPTPFIQLQGTILKGRHDMLLGTELIFTDDKETHDWNKRSVVHVGTTEQRIAFKEVTLIPKLPSSKGKEKAHADFELSAEERAVHIDRITGLSAPPPRAPRGRKPGSGAKAGNKKKTTTNQTAQAEYALPYSADTHTFQLDFSKDDNMDDMYMDAE